MNPVRVLPVPRAALFFVLLAGMPWGSVPAEAAVTVVRPPDPSAPLTQRWKWAGAEAAKAGYAKGYWAAYSIQRLMGEHSTIGSVYSDPRRNRPTLREVVTGTEDLDKRNPSGRWDDGDNEGFNDDRDDKAPQRQVMKEIAILFHFTEPRAGEPERVR